MQHASTPSSRPSTAASRCCAAGTHRDRCSCRTTRDLRPSFADVQRGWQALRGEWAARPAPAMRPSVALQAEAFVERIDVFVSAIELAARAPDGRPERLPVRDGGAGHRQRRGAALFGLPVHLQPAGAPADRARPRRRGRSGSAHRGRFGRRIRRALGGIQPHGGDLAGPVPDAGGQGPGKDPAAGDAAHPAGGALRGGRLRCPRHHARRTGAGLCPAGPAGGRGRRVGRALVRRVEPALPDAGLRLPAAGTRGRGTLHRAPATATAASPRRRPSRG